MKILNSCILALLLSSLVFAESGFLNRSVTMKGETFRYQVYLPADYNSKKSWPVIVSLHGNGPQGNDGQKHTESEALAVQIRQTPSLYPAIVIFPQAKVGTRWLYAEMEELVIAELDETLSEFRGDPRRVYLQGHSMGATGAYRIAYRWPERFAAVVASAGRVEPGSHYPPEQIQADRESNPFVTAPDPFGELALGLKHIPLWIFHGDADEQVAVEQSRKLVAALKKVKGKVRYTEYPGANHAGAPQKAFSEAEMIAWLFKQHR